MTVVTDGPDELVLWLPPGTPTVQGRLADGSDFRTLPAGERFHAVREPTVMPWRGPGVLKLVAHPVGPCCVWLFWDDAGEFRGWYGNLEEPQRLWTRPDGVHVVDSADHVLDLWCPVDGPPVWKDEDELAATTGLPGYWDDDGAAAIRATGERLRELAIAGRPPFDDRWTGFRPDPAWPTPVLPPGWELPGPG